MLYFSAPSNHRFCGGGIKLGATKMLEKLTFAVAFIMLSIAVNSYAEETWKITSLNWEPYSGAEMENQGSSIKKLREVLQKNGIKLIVEFYPWPRAQKIAKTKEYVGYFPAWPEEVHEGFIASPPVDWSLVSVLKRSGSSVSFDSIDDLFRKYNVGIVKTYTYPKVINDAMKKYPDHVDQAYDEIMLLKKLSIGRHLVAITDPNVMIYLSKNEDITNIEPIKVIMKKELVVALRDDKENAKRINLLKKLLNSTASR